MSRTSIEALYAVISMAGGPEVTEVEHREVDDWATGARRVEFRVTSANLNGTENERIRVAISTALENVRPAGIDFVVGVIPVTMDKPKGYPSPPQSTSPAPVEVPLANRNRFAAVVAEITESPRGELSALIGDVSRELVDLAPNGRLRCRRCSCEAFEPNVVQRPDGTLDVKVICRGCPPPEVLLSIDHIPDGLDVITTNPYRCWSCNRKSEVTMSISEMNLHCPRCKRATGHKRETSESVAAIRIRTPFKISARERVLPLRFDADVEWSEPKPAEGVAAIIDETARRIASVFAMDESAIDSKWEVVNVDSGQVVGTYDTSLTMKMSDGDVVTLENVDFAAAEEDVVKIQNDGTYVPGKGSYSISMKVVADDKVSPNAIELINSLNPNRRQKIPLQPEGDPLFNAIERMRTTLGLDPFITYASRQYQKNRENRLPDWMRRTGRTTFALIQALAKCAVDNVDYLLVDAATMRMVEYCCGVATEIRDRCTNEMPRVITAASSDYGFRRNSSEVVLYTDHTALER